jgi:mRNA interferase MazF
MRSTTIYERGDLVVVNVVFSDQGGAKPRPGIVISPEAFHRDLPDLLLCPVSSQERYYQDPGVGDHPLRAWEASGLRHPSTARASKVLAVDKAIIKRALGKIAKADMEGIDAVLTAAFGLP